MHGCFFAHAQTAHNHFKQGWEGGFCQPMCFSTVAFCAVPFVWARHLINYIHRLYIPKTMKDPNPLVGGMVVCLTMPFTLGCCGVT